jgi:hypothetical protein
MQKASQTIREHAARFQPLKNIARELHTHANVPSLAQKLTALPPSPTLPVSAPTVLLPPNPFQALQHKADKLLDSLAR